MKWNAFIIARNEEDIIEETIASIQNQSIPPNDILITNDGSTDSTGQILDDMPGVTVEHLPAHPPDLGSVRWWTERNDLMAKAIQGGIDYTVCLDADTILPSNYMEEITSRMRHDNVKVACGTEPMEFRLIPPESGLVIDVPWYLIQPIPFPAFPIVVRSLLEGHRAATYDVKITYRRKTGANYNPAQYEHRGKNSRSYGHSFWYIVLRSITIRSPHLLKGYLTHKGNLRSKELQRYVQKWEKDRIRVKMGFRSRLLERTDTALFLLPNLSS